MSCRGVLRVVTGGLLALGIAAGTPGPGWAQQAPPPASEPSSPSEPAEERPVANALATAAAVVGSLFYIPFKLGIICPGMALASGASLAVTGGDKPTAEYLLRVGCTGTYVITPGMVRGQEEYHGAGER